MFQFKSLLLEGLRRRIGRTYEQAMFQFSPSWQVEGLNDEPVTYDLFCADSFTQSPC